MRHVLWVRHGQSLSNAGHATRSPSDNDLTPLGHVQARAVAKLLPSQPDLIITSPYLRARRTAEPACERFPDAPLEEWPCEEFTYLALPAGLATTHAQRMPLVEAYWASGDPAAKDHGKGESFAEFSKRVHSVHTRIHERTHRLTVVFTHELFLIRLRIGAESGTFDATPAAMAEMNRRRREQYIPNGAAMQSTIDDSGRLRILGVDTAHLAGLTAPAPHASDRKPERAGA